MRQTPLVGIVVLLLFGLPGCAGFPQRLNWSAPSTDVSDAENTPAPSRLSWWRRPRPVAAAADSSGDLAEASQNPQPIASDKLPVDVWPESRSERLARQFPLMSRLWNGKAKGNTPDADPSPRSDVGRVSARSQPESMPRGGREDDDVRPVDASADDDIVTGGREAAADQGQRNMPAPLPPPLRITFSPRRSPEKPADDEPDASSSQDRPESQARSDQPEVAPQQPDSVSPESADSPAHLPMTPGAGSEADAHAGEPTDATPGSVSPPFAALELAANPAHVFGPSADAPPAQGAQAPPPVPPPSSLSEEKPGVDTTQPATSPPAPETPTRETQPPSPPPVPTAPAPVGGASPPQTSPVVQPRVSASSQSIYASPPPVAPRLKRRSFLSFLFVEERTEPLAMPQFPPATFPTTYHVNCPQPDQVLPAPQGSVATAPLVATQAAKKPCVLSVWLQKIKSCGRGSRCTGHHHHDSVPCCQGCTCHGPSGKAVSPSAQQNLAPSQQSAAAPRGNASLQAVPINSTGTKAGDVAQEGKLVETPAPEGLDKSPQS